MKISILTKLQVLKLSFLVGHLRMFNAIFSAGSNRPLILHPIFII